MTDDLQTDTCTDIFQNDQVTAIQVTIIQWMTVRSLRNWFITITTDEYKVKTTCQILKFVFKITMEMIVYYLRNGTFLCYQTQIYIIPCRRKTYLVTVVTLNNI